MSLLILDNLYSIGHSKGNAEQMEEYPLHLKDTMKVYIALKNTADDTDPKKSGRLIGHGRMQLLGTTVRLDQAQRQPNVAVSGQ